MNSRACDHCLARPWLLARLAGHLQRVRARIQSLLALADPELVAAVAGADAPAVRGELANFNAAAARARAAAAGLELICRCDDAYPPRLRALDAPPVVLHVAGGLGRLLELTERDCVAIVGARRASDYGLEIARTLGRGLGAAGVTVVSGMALGVDSAAHAGALDARARTLAVLPGSPERAYPPAKRGLHRAILAGGAAVSELGPGARVFGWMFPARNRLIAALAMMTVVVEAGERSGSLVTAELAQGIGIPVGAVPGRVTSPLAAGTNRLLAEGACVIRDAQDVVDHLYGAGALQVEARLRDPVPEPLRRLYEAIAAGEAPGAAFARAGFDPAQGLAALAELELACHVRRAPGGGYTAVR